MTEKLQPDATQHTSPIDDTGQAVRKESQQDDPVQDVSQSSTISVQSKSEPDNNADVKAEQNDYIVDVAQDVNGQNEEPDEKKEDGAGNNNSHFKVDDIPYSIFTHNEKRIIVICAGLCAFFSPISGQIYFPSLDVVATDLHVSATLANLTISTYLIMQGIAPAFVGGFSDSSGRRPTYLICVSIYIVANIGLGIQNSYPALMVLRCLQSAGGSGTVALASAVVSDIVTSQERGVYVSYLSLGPQAGPSLGPIIGGLLGQNLGWHSVFWFLLICTGVVFIPVALFFPETCRNVVDDGSVPPPKWSRCYINKKIENRLISEGKSIPYDKRDELAANRKIRFPNPLGTIRIVFTKEAGFALGYIGIVGCSYYATATLIPSQFGRVYGFNQIQIALCYLPLGCGSLFASLVRGKIIDSRYRYHAKRLGMPLEYNRRVDLSNFPIERARLEIAVPLLGFSTVCIIGFGWMIQYEVHLAGPIIFLFLIGFCISASVNTVSVLLVDLFPGKAGTAAAANNLVRCWLGAGATSGVLPLINRIGIGWTLTMFGSFNILFSPILWYIMKNGPDWRRATKEKKERKEIKRAARADVGGEKGHQ